MQKVVLFGECMLELRQGGTHSMSHSFAGDAFNTAVYLKRLFGNMDVSFMTAIGDDSISKQMHENCLNEGLNNQFVFTDNERALGIYLVQTDEQGERSFVYWRENSAARHVMQHVTQNVIDQLSTADLFFFSGISLAVIVPEQRAVFWDMLKQLKQAGVKIVFDPNYRARLWRSEDEAKVEFEQACVLSNLLLPGIEDFSQLYQLTTAEQIVEFCKPFQIEEMIIKHGAESLYIVEQEHIEEVKITPSTKVIDTTSAGDSFNGVYLGASLAGYEARRAVELASAAASCVIQHPGAIAPAQAFGHYMRQRFGELSFAG
ncbi:sugar kinase [Paraglaciecola aquimarina]|uniref:Sugar kinase n=1 Tax=Paraglaciecola aquimarina TaxID=1235557 RepID=A0ABU3SV80_9ALTE|nr:sugar kinase [Paraglaciecola aquimarina]MDU0353902.1 sugar kinase [Paraglaciecola aquimarina]